MGKFMDRLHENHEMRKAVHKEARRTFTDEKSHGLISRTFDSLKVWRRGFGKANYSLIHK